MDRTIKICSSHQHYQVPLIYTFAFNGSEYWCPFCGKNEGMLGAGESVPISADLRIRYRKFNQFSREYLHATGIMVCSSTMWNGKRIQPSELPKTEKDRLQKIRDNWKYGVRIEDVPIVLSLTKENFWNRMHRNNKEAVDDFCKWIDEYKKSVGWNMLFNSDSEYQNAAGKNAPAPKFHDLPLAMQIGILLQYMEEKIKEPVEIKLPEDDLIEIVEEFFENQQEKIDKEILKKDFLK